DESLIRNTRRSPDRDAAPPALCLPLVSCRGLPPAAGTTNSSPCTPRLATKKIDLPSVDQNARSEERRVGKERRWRGTAELSSRRRHTISTRDWSSDVCSSDLRCAVYWTIVATFFCKSSPPCHRMGT